MHDDSLDGQLIRQTMVGPTHMCTMHGLHCGGDGEPLLSSCHTSGTNAEDAATPPLLSLTDSRNVYAWLLGREILLRFGDRFRARIDYYMGIFSLLLLGLLIAVLLSLLLLPPERLSIQLLMVTGFLICALLSFLTLMAINLVHSNLQNAAHRFLLSQRSVEMSASPTAVGSLESLKASRAAIDCARQYLEVERELHPLAMLGVPATFSALSTVGAALALLPPLLADPMMQTLRAHYSTH